MEQRRGHKVSIAAARRISNKQRDFNQMIYVRLLSRSLAALMHMPTCSRISGFQ
jgi:hypothetical protein